MNKKAQGEIFGMALFFVILVIGILVFGKMTALKDSQKGDELQTGKYKIMAEGTINTIISMDTGCVIERDKSSVKDLILFCIENSFYNDDVSIDCGGSIGTIPACKTARNMINDSLWKAFNSTKGFGTIPFIFEMDIPANPDSQFSNKTFKNTGIDNDKEKVKLFLRRNGYKKAPSGLITWATADRPIQMELFLYYK